MDDYASEQDVSQAAVKMYNSIQDPVPYFNRVLNKKEISLRDVALSREYKKQTLLKYKQAKIFADKVMQRLLAALQEDSEPDPDLDFS